MFLTLRGISLLFPAVLVAGDGAVVWGVLLGLLVGGVGHELWFGVLLGWANQGGASFTGVFTLAGLLALTWKRGAVVVRGSRGVISFLSSVVLGYQGVRSSMNFRLRWAVSEFQLCSPSSSPASLINMLHSSPQRSGQNPPALHPCPARPAWLSLSCQQGCGS